MRRDEAISTIQYVVDDAGCGRRLGDDPHAILRTSGMDFKYESCIVVVNSTIGVVVHSYLDTRMDGAEAIELALDYLKEIGKASDGARVSCFIGESTETPVMSVERLAQLDPREVYNGEANSHADTR